jgi:death-on-curing protein
VIVYLEVKDLLDIATVVLGGPPKVRDSGLLDSACGRPKTSMFGQEAYPTLAEKAGALLHSICMNHALIDGNKRLAWAATVVFLGLNQDQQVPNIDEDDAEAFMLAVAGGAMNDVGDIAASLERLGLIR